MEQAAKPAATFMRIFNADGSEVESCGNAARCVAWLLMAEHETSQITIATAGGALICSRAGDEQVTVDMGPPRLDWREIPMAQAVDTENFAIPVPGFELDYLQNVAALSMGNPHCVLFVDDPESAPVTELGAALERHVWFPYRTNVEFVAAQGDDHLRMRVWERGEPWFSQSGTADGYELMTISRARFGGQTALRW